MFKKLGILLAVIGCGFFFGNSSAQANTDGTPGNVDIAYEETYPLLLDDGDTLNFFSEEDRDLYQQYYNLEKAGIELRHGNKTREKYISSTTFYNKFIGYNPLTPSWSYASSYTISRGKNLSFSTGYTYSGTSTTLTVSNSYGVAVTLPANSKKASRLAAKADVTVAKYKVELYNGTTVLQTFYTLRTTKVKNVTNYVHYR